MNRLNEVVDDDVQKQVLKSFIGREVITKDLNDISSWIFSVWKAFGKRY